MDPGKEFQHEAHEYHPFAVDYASIGRDRPSKPYDLPPVFDTGSPDWSATLVDILDWDPNELVASNGVELSGAQNESFDEVFAIDVLSTPSLATSSLATDGSSLKKSEETIEKEQERRSTKLRVRPKRFNNADPIPTPTFNCPITECNKEYAQQDNIYRHAQKAHPSHVFTCLGGTWTITPRDEKQDTPSKQRTKRKTPHNDEAHLISPSMKRQKQARTQTVLDRGDNASPLLYDPPIPLMNIAGLDVVDAATTADDSRGWHSKPDPASPVLLHGISVAAKSDESEGQDSVCSPDPHRTVFPSSGNSSFGVGIAQKPRSLTTPNDIPLRNQTFSNVTSSSSSSLGTLTDSVNIKCDLLGHPNSSPTDLRGIRGQPHSLDEGLDELMAPRFPHDPRSDGLSRSSYTSADISNHGISAYNRATGAVSSEGDINELARSHNSAELQVTSEDTAGEVNTRSGPFCKSNNPAATGKRKPRASADQVIARDGYENAEGLVIGGRNSRKRNMDKSKTSVTSKGRRGRGNK